MFCCCCFSLIIHGWLSFHAPVQVIHMFLYSLTCGRGREIPLYQFRIIYSWRVPWYLIYSVLCVFLTRFSHPFLKFELMTFWYNRAFHENLKLYFPLKLCEFIPNWPVNISVIPACRRCDLPQGGLALRFHLGSESSGLCSGSSGARWWFRCISGEHQAAGNWQSTGCQPQIHHSTHQGEGSSDNHEELC